MLQTRASALRFTEEMLEGEGFLSCGYALGFGDEMRLGSLDEDGRFVAASTPLSLPLQKMTSLGRGFALLLPCRAEVSTDDGRSLVTVEFAVVRGSPACCSISASTGEAITPSLLRALPLAQLARRTVRAHTARLARWCGQLVAVRTPSSMTVEQTPARGRRLSEDFLAEVAAVYREALRSGLPPAQEVMLRLGPTHPANARRWVALARDAGHLAPAPAQRRRGEAQR